MVLCLGSVWTQALAQTQERTGSGSLWFVLCVSHLKRRTRAQGEPPRAGWLVTVVWIRDPRALFPSPPHPRPEQMRTQVQHDRGPTAPDMGE